MGSKAPALKPRQGKPKRCITLSLSQENCDRLKAIQEQHGVRPSVVVDRMLDKNLASGADSPLPN